ncbi:MAG: MFS transporter [Synergistaceae bacterium]|nr:MFS transporter [Synergistaceae bacterium]
MLKLLFTRRFMPLFMTQFLGAFNDNFFKSALIMLITYKIGDAAGIDPRILVNAAAGVFILPFFLFASPASDLADKYDRSRLMRWVKFAEIIIMIAAAIGFYLNSLDFKIIATWFLLSVLFLMGAQSAFFSPAKYSILPQHLNPDEIIAGNGLIQMGTYLAILSGTIAGGLLVLRSVVITGNLVVLIALLGWLSSLLIPDTKPINPNLKLDFKIKSVINKTISLWHEVTPMRDVFLSMLAISWFWLVGAVFLAQFPTYAKSVLNADESVATAFLAIFSLGIGLGSMTCDAILKGKITTRYVPFSAYGIAIASVLLYLLSNNNINNNNIINARQFFTSLSNLPIPLCLFAIAFFGGLYIVPLYAVMQTKAPESKVSGVIACSNISDSLFMAVSAVLASVLIALNFEIAQIFLLTGLLTFIIGVLINLKLKI